ncbi:MAG: hypothetical protein KY461_09565 [Actinobacteria bacterium]|nr:hypothetical protein [Actinomycetota bacterium]
MSTPESAKLDAATRAAEAVDARKEPSAGRGPTEDEAAAAERAAPVDPEVAETYQDQLERGAEQEGEGAIDVADDGIPPLSQ